MNAMPALCIASSLQLAVNLTDMLSLVKGLQLKGLIAYCSQEHHGQNIWSHMVASIVNVLSAQNQVEQGAG
jgi:hypothetical protein